MAREIGWELYRSFLGVLQEGSLSGAARALGITQPTVGRHLSALEKSLGLVLFTRSQAGLLPTEAAAALRGHAEVMGSTAAALRRAAEGQGEGKGGIQGTVRVSASDVIGAEVLPPIVAQLRLRHPQLKVEIVLSNRVQDLLLREADVAIRMTPPRHQALLARKVGSIPVGLFAHRDYLALHPAPKDLQALARHALVGFDQETPFLRAARKGFPAWSREAFSLRADSDLAQMALVRAGCGIGVYQVGLAKRDPSLVRVLPRHFDLRLDTWVTMHGDLRSSPHCKAAFDALARGLAVYVG